MNASRRLLLLALAMLTACARRGEKLRAAPSATAAPVEDSDVATRQPLRPTGSQPVIWIGLDALDWEMVDRLAREGRMPNWARLVREGYSARLQSFFPLISPILWTTAATGVPPDVHRVLDFQEVDPQTGTKVPISGRSRAVAAVWNVASEAGRHVGVVGWWATHPAEEVRGFFVTDRASPILFDAGSLAGVAYPQSLEQGVEQVVARDGRVGDEEIARWLGASAGEIATARSSGAGMESRPVALARILASTRVLHRVARDLYDRDHPDLTALYLEGTDEIAHVFASYAPPRLPCVSAGDAARYGHVADDYYALVDRMLGQWMRRAAEDGATLLVHSDHGFKWGADRPCGFSSASWSTAAYWHRPQGVLSAWGARVRPAASRADTSLFDVAPTVLALLGLPADRRMPGAPLAGILGSVAPPPRRAEPAAIVVRRVAAQPVSPAQASEYAKKLLALGYLSPGEARPLQAPGGDAPGVTEGGWNNLGVYERDTRHDPRAARQAFQTALSLRPDYYSAIFNLAVLDRAQGQFARAQDELFRSVAAVGQDPAPALSSWAHEDERAGRVRQALSILERGVREYPGNEALARELGMARFRARDCRGAVAALSGFEAASRDPRTFNALALFQTCLEDRPAVVRLLERSLAVKPDQPEVAHSLAVARGDGR